MIDYKDLVFKHKKNCKFKDSSRILKTDITRIESPLFNGNGDNFVVEYKAYCSECGNYLYKFNYGCIDMY